MKTQTRKSAILATLGLAAFGVLALGALESPVTAQVIPPPTVIKTNVKKVLLYDRRLTNNHTAYQALRRSYRRLALRYNFQVDSSAVSNYVTASTLSDVQVAIFHQGDGQVLSSTGETALRNFVEVQGKGVLMVHAAGAFVPCPTNGEENLSNSGCLFLAQVAVRQYYHHNNDGTSATIYMDSVVAGQVPPNSLVGAPAATINHGLANPETRNIFVGLPRTKTGVTDEWYTFRANPRATNSSMVFNGVTHGPVNVLISVDEGTFTETSPSLGNHPLAWTRKMGNGLGAYNSIGHSDIYTRSDSIMQWFNWNLTRYLARDYVGCTDPAYLEYNPEASVAVLSAGFDDPEPCKNTTAILGRAGAAARGITVTPSGFRVATPEEGSYRVLVTDARGKRLYFKQVEGGRDRSAQIDLPGLSKGAYLIRLDAPRTGTRSARVSWR